MREKLTSWRRNEVLEGFADVLDEVEIELAEARRLADRLLVRRPSRSPSAPRRRRRATSRRAASRNARRRPRTTAWRSRPSRWPASASRAKARRSSRRARFMPSRPTFWTSSKPLIIVVTLALSGITPASRGCRNGIYAVQHKMQAHFAVQQKFRCAWQADILLNSNDEIFSVGKPFRGRGGGLPLESSKRLHCEEAFRVAYPDDLALSSPGPGRLPVAVRRRRSRPRRTRNTRRSSSTRTPARRCSPATPMRGAIRPRSPR